MEDFRDEDEVSIGAFKLKMSYLLCFVKIIALFFDVMSYQFLVICKAL